MPINCYTKSDWQEGIIEKILPGVFIGRLVCANNKFEGREAKGMSKGRYDGTFAGEDGIQPEKAQTPIAWERPATLASDTPRPLYSKKTPKKLVEYNVSFRTVHWTMVYRKEQKDELWHIP